MNKQAENGIGWCTHTWSPITGCLHGCTYCYARKIANRFGSAPSKTVHNLAHVIEKPMGTELKPIIQEPHGTRYNPYPFGFEPTFHEYRLDEPTKIKKPQIIFVCSMADLFGDFIPSHWITEVFTACSAAPQHQYLFLTKNPKRYIELDDKLLLPTADNFWYGTTITNSTDRFLRNTTDHNTFLSIEPVMEKLEIPPCTLGVDWIIIGAETGNRKGKVIPEKEWIDSIVDHSKLYATPVFMKESLRGLMGDDFIQEWPEQMKKNR